MNRREVARRIDHTLLKPEARAADVERLCAEAAAFGCAAVCVNGARVAQAAALLRGTDVAVASVVGFPLGAMHPAAKAAETAQALDDGAAEIDVVIHVGALKEGDDAAVVSDLRGVVLAAGEAVPVKAILETGLLDDEEKRRAARLAVEAGCAFVKTSTGFGPGGATVEDVKLLKDAVEGRALVKASGGIRDARTCLALIEAGADRIGASRTAEILAGLPEA